MQGAKLLRCDLETGEPLRNASGRCEAAGEGATGLFVSPISRLIPFDGYADEAATRKIWRMRGPVAESILFKRAAFDPEYLGLRLLAEEESGVEGRTFREDLARIDARDEAAE